ncbi:hypothetical protein RIF29_13906 [Crotalaria pallida]|uniref:Uncharacterized protein n=1 Tax=Crotalaria pallida TaxID=3830 RepID=A0AAN9FEI6_CROPI
MSPAPNLNRIILNSSLDHDLRMVKSRNHLTIVIVTTTMHSSCREWNGFTKAPWLLAPVSRGFTACADRDQM